MLPAPVDAGVELEAEEGDPEDVGDPPLAPDTFVIRYISPDASDDTKIRP